MSNILKDELHLHLYGCLTPKDLFQLGKDRYKSRSQALNWYATEYETHTGRRPDWGKYWQSSHGEELIAKDFLATELMRFPQFQVRFNLMIALLPTTEHAITVLNQIVPEQIKQGISYSEFRVFVPPFLQPDALKPYYEYLAEGSAKSNSTFKNAHTSRIVLSVSRDPKVFTQQYQVLRDLQRLSKAVAEQITGLDFCGVEEGHPPELQKQVFETIQRDNIANPAHSLAILYHVGESFDDMSVFSAMRWIHLSAEMGAHRLGHATAAGIGIKNSGRFEDGTTFYEPRKEAQMFLSFLKRLLNETDIAENGVFLANTYKEALLIQSSKSQLEFTWNSELRQAATALQTWILKQLAEKGSVVESCPTSNRIIGRIEDEADLPVFQFSEKKVPLIVSSDDPGIFATSLAHEESICRQNNRISSETMHLIAQNNQRYRAGILAGRSAW
jgi:adenosine deaminase